MKKLISKILYKTLPVIQKFTEKDTIILMDFDDGAELIDCLSMFEWLQEHNIKSRYLVGKKCPQAKELKAKYGKNVIVFEKYKNIIFKIFGMLAKTKYFLTSFGAQDKYLAQFLRDNKYIDYIFMQHGVVFTTLRAFQSHHQNVYDKILVSSSQEAELWTKYCNIDKKDLIKVGLPRWDLLNNLPKSKEKSIFLFPTWRMTFREKNFKDSQYYKSLVSLSNNKELNKILKDNSIKLYYGMHHVLKNNSLSDFKLDNVEIVDMLKVSDYIKKCDLLITDYSSIWVDFAFQNKPVLFYLMDYQDKYLNELDIQSSGTAYTQLDKLFNKCTTEQEVVNMIKLYIKRNFDLESTKKDILNDFFYCRKDIRNTIYGFLKKEW